MWRNCTTCKLPFFRGGSQKAGIRCPDCKMKKRKKALIRNLKKRKYDVCLLTDQKGNIIKKEVNWPERVCKFCNETKPMRNKNGVYCIDCIALKARDIRDNAKALNCEGCSEMFWSNNNLARPYCSPECKEVLREHFECITCGERILSEKNINTKYCNSHCASTFTLIVRLRKDRKRKGTNALFRYNEVKTLNVKQSIIDEFRENIDEE
tara:strand:- start:2025 stop:2651 length:627 start_codon:yes stop_codon:yes gene_type:complete